VCVVYLNDLEAERLQHCPTLCHARVYLAALRLQKDDPIQPWRFFKAARVSPRRGQLALAELVRRTWLRKEAYGPPGERRTVRFVSTARTDQAIAPDRLGVIASDRLGVIASDRLRDGGKRSPAIACSLDDPDLPSGKVVSKTEPSVRTEGMQGEGNGRTDGSKKFADVARRLVGSIASDWQLPEPVVEKCVARFCVELDAVEPVPTERDLWRYVRAAFQHREHRHSHPAFAGINFEKFLGCACTRLRFDMWREHERKRAATLRADRDRELELERSDDEALTPAQLHVLLEERARSVGQ